MSENTTDLSTNFSPEEWTLIKSAPLLAGLSVTLADLRSGIFGAIKEGIAPSQAIIEAGRNLRIPSSRRWLPASKRWQQSANDFNRP